MCQLSMKREACVASATVNDPVWIGLDLGAGYLIKKNIFSHLTCNRLTLINAIFPGTKTKIDLSKLPGSFPGLG